MIATIIQVAGAAAITTGFALIFPPLGWLVGGAFAVLFGIAIERGNKNAE